MEDNVRAQIEQLVQAIGVNAIMSVATDTAHATLLEFIGQNAQIRQVNIGMVESLQAEWDVSMSPSPKKGLASVRFKKCLEAPVYRVAEIEIHRLQAIGAWKEGAKIKETIYEIGAITISVLEPYGTTG